MATNSLEEYLKILDAFFCTVYRFRKEDVRDQVFKGIKVLDKEHLEVPNKDDYLAKGTDPDGYFFVILRDKDTKVNNIFSYNDDGGINKSNYLDIQFYKAAFKQQHH